MSKRKKYNPRKHTASFARIKLAIGKSMLTPTDDLDILDDPYAALEALRSGTLDFDGFCKLVEISTAAYVTGALIQKRGVGETKAFGWMVKQSGEDASEKLADIAARVHMRGKYIARGEELIAVSDALEVMRKAIPILTRGELIEALEVAATIVEDGLTTAARLKEAS